MVFANDSTNIVTVHGKKRDWREAESVSHENIVDPRGRKRHCNDSEHEAPPREQLATNKVETDPRRLSQRRKEIRYGKNTLGYDRYTTLVPKNSRKKGHPRTPDVTLKVSKRQFDGIVRAWRRKLHEWDPPGHQQKLVRPTNVTASAPAPATVEENVIIRQENEEDDGLGPDIFVGTIPVSDPEMPSLPPANHPCIVHMQEFEDDSMHDVVSDDDLL